MFFWVPFCPIHYSKKLTNVWEFFSTEHLSSVNRYVLGSVVIPGGKWTIVELSWTLTCGAEVPLVAFSMSEEAARDFSLDAASSSWSSFIMRRKFHAIPEDAWKISNHPKIEHILVKNIKNIIKLLECLLQENENGFGMKIFSSTGRPMSS